MSDENDDSKDEAQLGEAGKRALEAERHARRVAEGKQRAAEQALADREFEDVRREVAEAKGLHPSFAGRLKGGTREEIEKDADELAAFFESERKPRSGMPSLPRERLRGGTDPSDEGEPDAGAIADRIMAPPV